MGSCAQLVRSTVWMNVSDFGFVDELSQSLQF